MVSAILYYTYDRLIYYLFTTPSHCLRLTIYLSLLYYYDYYVYSAIFLNMVSGSSQRFWQRSKRFFATPETFFATIVTIFVVHNELWLCLCNAARNDVRDARNALRDGCNDVRVGPPLPSPLWTPWPPWPSLSSSLSLLGLPEPPWPP